MTNKKFANEMGKSKSDQVLSDLITFILKKNYKVGDRIVPERVLAEILNTSRATIREVLGILVDRKILSKKRGSGIYLSESVAAFNAFNDDIQGTENKIQDQMEALYTFYPVVTGLASKRASEIEINEIMECTIQISKAIFARDLEKIIAADKNFHRIICRMTKNRKLIEMFEILLQGNRIIWENTIQKDGFINNTIFAGYVSIVNAIKERNQSDAIHYSRQNIKKICEWFEKNEKINCLGLATQSDSIS